MPRAKRKKATKKRRWPQRQPYTEIRVRVPNVLLRLLEPWVGFTGRDIEEVLVYVIRCYVTDHYKASEHLKAWKELHG